MVIVIMGDVGSGCNSVGKPLAEYLGWEFVDVETPACNPAARNSQTDVDCTPNMKALYARIDCLKYEGRDVILSCSISDEKKQAPLYRHPLVKFVYLKALDKTDEFLSLQKRPDNSNLELSVKQDRTPDRGDRMLTVDPGQRIEQILKTVLSELILK
jgi:gluconate kinase